MPQAPTTAESRPARPAWRARSTGSEPGRDTDNGQAVVRSASSVAIRQAIGFGLFSGWLELALVLARRAIDPRIPMSALRTNRHFPWMIPASNVLLFSAVGLLVALLAMRRPALGKWLTSRVYLGLTALTLLLEIEGLHQAACLVLAAGVGAAVGPATARWIDRFRRPVWIGALVAGSCLIPLTIVTYRAVTRAESRAIAALPAARPGKPNVLLIVLDNVRASSLSLLGRERPTTPNLERLARSGMVFTQARSTSSWTLPSHASLFTGRWCHELSFDFDRALDAATPTLAEALGREGYATAGFVANTYYGNILYGLGRGFARYEDHYENLAVTPFEIVRSTSLGKAVLHALGYPIRTEEEPSIRKTAEMINRDALNWLDHRPAARPFLLFLNYFDAHAPFIPPDGPDPRFGMAALPLAERAEIIAKDLRLSSGKLRLDAMRDADEIERIRRDAANARTDSYESCIAYLDRQIGLLFDELDRRGLRDDTLIVVTSDHGEHIGERGFYGHGLSLYRPEVHVPLLIFPPHAAKHAGRVVDAPVSIRDVAATVVDVLGVSAPDQTPFPGQSLARYYRTENHVETSPLLMELGHRESLPRSADIPTSLGRTQAIVKDGNVYIRNGEGREELYSLSTDPLEKHNLIAIPDFPPAALAGYRSALERGFSRSPASP